MIAMTDFKGNGVKPGDKVVYIYSNWTGGRTLKEGVIESIQRGYAVISGAHKSISDTDPADAKEISHERDNGTTWDNKVRVKSGSIYKV